MNRPRVLILTGCYPPGFRGGGPVRSVSNLVDSLHESLDFSVITLDRDRPDDPPYAGVVPDRWQVRGHARVLYLARSAVTLRRLVHEVTTARPDVIYLNGFFDPLFSLRMLLARRLGLLATRAVVLAPRGDCSPGALQVKALKKSIFVPCARALGLYRNLTWHVSTERERDELVAVAGPQAEGQVWVVPNLTDPAPAAPIDRGASDGVLRVCFLSRVSPKKNLDYAIRVLANVSTPVRFVIYGPIEDRAYWSACEALLAGLPAHITARYDGEVLPEDVRARVAQHDVFFLPTRGENFGHVIYEALSAGVPVLVSDQTPWVDLDTHGVGWSLPLQEPSAFVRAIEAAAIMNSSDRSLMSARAMSFAEAAVDRPRVVARTLESFRHLVAR